MRQDPYQQAWRERYASARADAGKDRRVALLKGHRFYEAKPCKACDNGKGTLRYTKSRACLACRFDAEFKAHQDGASAARTKARKRSYKIAELQRLRLNRAQAKAAQLAQIPDGMTSPMAQLLGTIL